MTAQETNKLTLDSAVANVRARIRDAASSGHFRVDCHVDILAAAHVRAALQSDGYWVRSGEGRNELFIDWSAP